MIKIIIKKRLKSRGTNNFHNITRYIVMNTYLYLRIYLTIKYIIKLISRYAHMIDKEFVGLYITNEFIREQHIKINLICLITGKLNKKDVFNPQPNKSIKLINEIIYDICLFEKIIRTYLIF